MNARLEQGRLSVDIGIRQESPRSRFYARVDAEIVRLSLSYVDYVGGRVNQVRVGNYRVRLSPLK